MEGDKVAVTTKQHLRPAGPERPGRSRDCGQAPGEITAILLIRQQSAYASNP